LRRKNEFFLFVMVNAFCAATETGVVAQAYLHKDEIFPVAHDQVDFTAPTEKVSGDQFQTMMSQVTASQAFRFPAAQTGAGGGMGLF